MQLYTVKFTNKHIVTKYDNRGKAIGTYETAVAQTLNDLPHSTAMQYKDCDNFEITKYVMEVQSKVKPGNQFKFERDGNEIRERHVSNYKTKAKHVKSAHTPAAKSITEAARTGDMSAALSS